MPCTSGNLELHDSNIIIVSLNKASNSGSAALARAPNYRLFSFFFFFFFLKNFSFSFLQGGSNACGSEMHQLSADQWEGSGWQHGGRGEVGGALQH